MERYDSFQYTEGSFDSHWEFQPVFQQTFTRNPTTHEDSGNSKDIQQCCEHLRFSWNLHGLLDFLVKAWRYCPVQYLRMSMKFQADNYAKLLTWNFMSYSKKIKDVEIPWTFKYIQAHKSWNF